MTKEKISPYEKAIEELIKVNIMGEPFKQVLMIITNMYTEYDKIIKNLSTQVPRTSQDDIKIYNKELSKIRKSQSG